MRSLLSALALGDIWVYHVFIIGCGIHLPHDVVAQAEVVDYLVKAPESRAHLSYMSDRVLSLS
jgi:hypothetical protein